jgi:hypothetical protein
MFKHIEVNGYFLKGKVKEICMSSFEGIEKDIELDAHEETIAQLIGEKIKTEIKPKAKQVYLFCWEGSYLDSGSFKNQTGFTCELLQETSTEFRKLAKKFQKDDEKAMRKEEKESEDE